ncbi:hypothetical protein AB3N59_20415 (plasmid) [Leptospira sp. WS92.C1]
MKTILQIIKNKGGYEKLKEEEAIKIENKPFMDLHIEYIGEGPNGYDAISVAHYYEQNGDLMKDPEVCFEVRDVEILKLVKGVPQVVIEKVLVPYLFIQDSSRLSKYDEVYTTDEDGKVVYENRDLLYRLKNFSDFWNKNLKQQGFVIASKEKKGGQE